MILNGALLFDDNIYVIYIHVHVKDEFVFGR